MSEKTLLDDPNFREFYVTAKRSTYAAGGDQKAEVMENGGKRYVFWDKKRWPQWRYIDTYYGYNPFFGNETVEEAPCVPPVIWTPIAQMSYSGYAKGTEDEVKRIFAFLEKMLQRVSIQSLFRGPEMPFVENDLYYYCFWIRKGPFRVDGLENIQHYPPKLGSLACPPYELDFQFSCLR